MVDTTLAFNVLAKDNASDTFKKVGKSGEDTVKKLGGLGKESEKAGDGVGKRFGIGFSKRIPELGTRVSGFFKTGIGAAAGLAAGAVLGGSLIEGVKGALAQGDVKAKFEAQLDLSGPAAAKAGKIAGDLYTSNYGDSLGGVNDAIKSVVQNTSVGLNSIDLKPVTAKVLDLAGTFDQDLGGVTRAVGQLMRTGLAKNATEALDIITKGFQSGADKSEDFLDTLNEYGTQFRKLGINGATATGLISQGLKAGARDGDLVADSIKEFSIRAIDGSATTAAGFKAIGLSAKDMAERIAKGGKPASDGLQLVLDKLRSIKDPVKQSAAAVELFGTQAEDMGAALFALDPAHAVDALGQVGGAADRLDKKVGSTPQAVITGYWRSIQQGSIEAFAVVAQKIAEGVTGIVGLGKRIVTAIGPVDLSGIATGIFNDTKAWASSIIGGLKTGVETGDWKPLGSAVGDGMISAIRNVGDKGGEILDAVGSLIDRIDWAGLGVKVSNGVTGLLKGVDWKALGRSVGDAALNIVEKSADLGAKVGTAVKIVMGKIDWKQIGNDSTNAVIGFIEGIDWVRVAKSLGIALFKSLKVDVQLKDAVTKSAGDLIVGIWAAILHEINLREDEAVAWMGRVGGELIAGLWGGIKSGVGGVGDFLKKTIVDPVVGWMKSLFGVHSPSTVFAYIGSQLMAGLKAGLVGGYVAVARWLSGLKTSVLAWIGDTAGTLAGKGRDLLQGLWSAAQQKWGSVGRWLSGVPGSAGRWVGTVTGTLSQKGRDLLQGFWSGMTGKWGEVTKWVGGIATWIKDHKGPVSLDGRLLIPAGAAIMSGFLKGLKSGAGPAWDFVNSVGGKTVSALKSAIGGPLGGAGKAPENPSGMAALVRTVAGQRGWGSGPEWDALYQLVQHESGFNSNAQNPTSSAYGLFQFLDSTWGSVGASKTGDPWAQTTAGLRYIAGSYGDPINAWAKWQSRSPHWYAKGTPWVPNDQLAYVHKGEAIVPAAVNKARLANRGGTQPTIVINVNGALDPNAVARQIQQMLLRLKNSNRGELGLA
jgi:hypothetical protein